MFGLLIAAACTVGLFRLWGPRRFGRGPGGPHRLNRLIRKLDATPTQEAAIRQSAEEIRQAFRNLNPRSRISVLSVALTAETVDRDQLLKEMREPETGSLSEALVNAVQRLRDTVGPSQRQQMAAMMLGGGGRMRGCH